MTTLPAHPHPPTHVLLLEDQAALREMTVEWLELEGFRVTAVGNGNDALAACEGSLPDVVIADIGVPGLNGYEVLQALRARPGGDALVFFILSGQDKATQPAEAAGATAFLYKPFDPNDLVDLIRRHLKPLPPVAPDQ